MSVKKKYCLTYPEFYLLAGSMGISHFYGFKDETMDVHGEKEIVRLLFRLTNKHFLDVNETGYQVVTPMRHILEGIRTAPKLIKVFATDRRFPMRCIYLGQNPVVVELGGLQGKFLKFYEEEWTELLENLCIDGIFLPQNVSDDLLYREQELMLEELPDVALKLLLQPIDRNGDAFSNQKLNSMGVQTVLELHDTVEGKIWERMLLITGLLVDIIIVQKKDDIELYCYSQNKLDELVRKMQEE